jgi:hypothetical protein
LASLLITNSNINDNSIDPAKLTGGLALSFDSVQGGTSASNSHLKAATVQTYNVADLAITGAKIAASTIKSNNITNAAFGGNG